MPEKTLFYDAAGNTVDDASQAASFVHIVLDEAGNVLSEQFGSVGDEKGRIMAPSALDRLEKSLDYGDVHVPRLGDDGMKDDDKIEEEDEGLQKGSDSDIVRTVLQDEGTGLDALRQALEGTTDPRLKEILEAIQEDEQKHNAALEQYLQEMEGGEGEEMPEGEGEGEGEGGPGPEEGEGEAEAGAGAGAEDEGPTEMGEISEDDEDLDKDEDPGQGEPAGAGDKSDLIEDIRAVLAEHSGEGEELGKEDEPGEGSGEGEEEDEDDEDLPFLKEDEETEKRCSKSFRVPFLAKSADQQIVYGIVSEPDSIDLQGDRLSESEIRKACHKFMQTSQRISKEHEGTAKADIIESYIAPVDFMCGGQQVKKGSWIMACKIHDPELWQAVKKGDLTGFSIAGTGTRTPF